MTSKSAQPILCPGLHTRVTIAKSEDSPLAKWTQIAKACLQFSLGLQPTWLVRPANRASTMHGEYGPGSIHTARQTMKAGAPKVRDHERPRSETVIGAKS